jgi:hypothetical protein
MALSEEALKTFRNSLRTFGRAVYGVGLRSLDFWDCGFESHRLYGCRSYSNTARWQVEVVATGRSLIQRSPTECVCLCVCVCVCVRSLSLIRCTKTLYTYSMSVGEQKHKEKRYKTRNKNKKKSERIKGRA